VALVGAIPTPAAEESHNVEKRSPDDDFYYFLPRRSFGGFNTQGRTSSFRGFFNQRRPGGYFYDLDDLFDDRRKRHTLPADAPPTHRQKRSADFDFDDDDDFFWYRRPLTTAVTYTVPRTSVSSVVSRPVFAPARRYFYSFDDDHFDRKKRSAEPDEDDYYHYIYNAPVTTYRLPVQTVVSTQPRTTQAVVYSPLRYYYDFDFDDDKK